MEHFQLRDDLLPYGRFHLEVDHLLGHHGARSAVTDTVDHATIACAEFTNLEEGANSAHMYIHIFVFQITYVKLQGCNLNFVRLFL